MHDFDLRLTDYYGPAVARALGALWTEAELAAAIDTASQVVTKAVDPVSERVLAAVRDALGTTGNVADLESVMRQAFVDAFGAGAHVAAGQLPENPGPLSTRVSTAALSGPAWSSWQPGHPAAAALTQSGGMRAMLDAAGVGIKGLVDTTVDQLGNRIADGLAAGDSVDKIGRGLRSLLGGNASRAELIAHTETARAMTQASAAVYAANGIGQWSLVTSAGACPVCVNVEAGGPYAVDDQANMPPLHPRCRCAIAPLVGSVALGAPTAGAPDWLGDALSALGDLLGAGDEAAALDAGGLADEELDDGGAADTGGDLVDDDLGGDLVDEAELDAEAETAETAETAEAGPAGSGGAVDLTALDDDALAEALGTASDDEVEQILAELDRREAADTAAETAQAVTEPAPTAGSKAALEAERDAAFDAALEAGEDAEAAYSRIYGVDVERMRRDEAIASLRSQGYKGRGFDELVRAAFRDYAEQSYWNAEAQTNGYFLNPAGRSAQIDARSLFTGPESRARKYASRELLDYWQANGRLTVDDFRASLLGGAMRSASTAAWS